MQLIQIPQTDLSVSRFCMGTGAFGTSICDSVVDKLVSEYIEAGGNFFDTAHCYAFWKPNGLGASEKELGASLRRLGKINSVVIATKGGHPDGGKDYPRPANFLSGSVIHSDIDDSLNRLQVDKIDLFYLHRDDGVTPVSHIINILNQEIEKGRIGYIGASNWSVSRMAAANDFASKNGLQGFVISQVQWSLSEPDWQETLDPTMRKVGEEEINWHFQNKIPIACYSSTGNGFFSKPCPQSESVNKRRWELVRQMSAKLNCTPTQLAVGWLLNQQPTILPIFSTSKVEHLKEIISADQLILNKKMVQELLSTVLDDNLP